MNTQRYQKGLTFWSLCFVLGVLAFVLFVGFKLIPPYLTDMNISKALEQLSKQSDVGSMSKGEAGEVLRKQFEIDGIEGAIKLDKDFTIEPRGKGQKLLRIRYEEVIPLFANMSILIEFDHQKTVKSGDG